MKINHVVLGGRTSKDPQVKHTSTGKTVCQGSIAIEGNKPKDPNQKPEVSFFTIEAWGSVADHMATIPKGTKVTVIGRLKQQSWVDKQTNQKRSAVVIVAEQFSEVPDSKKPQQQQASNEAQQDEAQTAPAPGDEPF